MFVIFHNCFLWPFPFAQSIPLLVFFNLNIFSSFFLSLLPTALGGVQGVRRDRAGQRRPRGGE